MYCTSISNPHRHVNSSNEKHRCDIVTCRQCCISNYLLGMWRSWSKFAFVERVVCVIGWIWEKTGLSALSASLWWSVHIKSATERGFFHQFAFNNKALKRKRSSNFESGENVLSSNVVKFEFRHIPTIYGASALKVSKYCIILSVWCHWRQQLWGDADKYKLAKKTFPVHVLHSIHAQSLINAEST